MDVDEPQSVRVENRESIGARGNRQDLQRETTREFKDLKTVTLEVTIQG